MKKKKNLRILLLVLILGIGAIIAGEIIFPTTLSENPLTVSSETYLEGEDEIDWDQMNSSTIELENSITITTGGIYTITGTLEDGSITINTQDYVKLILDDVTITNSSGPAIYIENANLTYIELKGENTLTDGSVYSMQDADINGCIYSNDDLVLGGSGTLTLTANYQDGIVSKDHLKIVSGTYNITSVDDGIRGRDSLYILDGTFNITAQGDGMKTSNDEDESLGNIDIENGKFTIVSELDGIQSVNTLTISNGTFNITTGGGATVSSTQSPEWGFWGNSTEDDPSAKGIKAENELVISTGTYTLNTSDDAIHSNSSITVSNGTFNITSGDDGIHADETLTIDGGLITISQSYEGLEGLNIEINNGEIEVTASDDGINCAGGSDGSSFDRPGFGGFGSTDTSASLVINGGDLTINATGDGLDSNGTMDINGGYIVVEGPTNDGNTSVDFESYCKVTGGTLIATGSSGMLEEISSDSTQNVITIVFDTASTSSITITDESGNTVLEITPSKEYEALIFSSSTLQSNQTYTILQDGVVFTTIETTSTSVSNSSGGMMSGGFGGMGGMPNMHSNSSSSNS